MGAKTTTVTILKAYQEEIDKILIAQSAYESISEKEKDTLFNAGKK